MRLDGATALVTGASGGLGQAIALALHERGARLVLSGRRVEPLEELASRIGARVIPADLRDQDSLERLARDCAGADVLVANAGLSAGGEIRSHDADTIDAALSVNLRAPMILARMMCEPMIGRGRGHIVFVSSLNGKAASPGSAVYSATKFGLRGFSLGLREDLRPLGVGVSAIFPGFVRDAGMFADAEATLPRFVGTSSPEEVGSATVRAIERNRAELDVAPVALRAGTKVAALLPGFAGRVQALGGGAEIARQIRAGQDRAERQRTGDDR